MADEAKQGQQAQGGAAAVEGATDKSVGTGVPTEAQFERFEEEMDETLGDTELPSAGGPAV